MVEYLIGFFQSEKFSAFHITVVSNKSDAIEFLKSKLTACAAYIHCDSTKLDFINTSLDIFVKKAQILGSKYDFIEYNGGLSIDENYIENLAGFRDILSPIGVIGVTYFSSNRHIDIINTHLSMLNKTVFLPFSMESARYVRQYLKLHKLDFMSSDDQLMAFLGAEPISRKYPNDKLVNVIPSVRWRSYMKDDIIHVLEDSKLFAAAWIPTAYTNPYGKDCSFPLFYHFIEIFKQMK
jgi:hypothetical protein